MTFLTMGDRKYFATLRLSAQQALRFYPHARFLLYDWGLETEQRRDLSVLSNVEIVDWRERVPSSDRVRGDLRGVKRFIKRALLRHPLLLRPAEQWQREFLLGEKCYCMVDAAARIDGPFLFLDADAFIVNRVDALLDSPLDIVVTLRPSHEIKAARARRSRHDINSGVILLGADRHRRRTFLIEWVKEMNLLNLLSHSLSEQTALSNLLLRANPRAFVDRLGRVDLIIGNQTIRCGIEPTEAYNYNRVEEGFDPARNRILHLKSGRAQARGVEALQGMLDGCDLSRRDGEPIP